MKSWYSGSPKCRKSISIPVSCFGGGDEAALKWVLPGSWRVRCRANTAAAPNAPEGSPTVLACKALIGELRSHARICLCQAQRALFLSNRTFKTGTEDRYRGSAGDVAVLPRLRPPRPLLPPPMRPPLMATPGFPFGIPPSAGHPGPYPGVAPPWPPPPFLHGLPPRPTGAPQLLLL